MKIEDDKWYVVHPAHTGRQDLVVKQGKDVAQTATANHLEVLNTRTQGRFNHLDYVEDGPFDTKLEAVESRRWAHAHNWALWGSLDDDQPGR